MGVVGNSPDRCPRLPLLLVVAIAMLALLGLDTAAAQAATITGRVTNDAGEPLSGTLVQTLNQDGQLRGVLTDADGNYIVSRLPGTYRLRTYKQQGYLDQWYAGVPVYADPGGFAATRVSLATWESEVTGIDFVLARGRTISGRVTNEIGEPIAGVSVQVFDVQDWNDPRSAATEGDGSYTIIGLSPRAHKVRAWGGGLADEWYGDVPAGAYHDRGELATSVDLTSGDAAGIDMVLTPPRTISGRVLNDSDQPLEGIWVEAISEIWSEAATRAPEWFIGGDVPAPEWLRSGTFTESDGSFTIWGLHGSSYRIGTDTEGGTDFYPAQWYSNVLRNVLREADPTGTGATPVDLLPADASIEIVLSPRYRRISGRVSDETGAPLSVEVRARNVQDGLSYSTYASSDGTYNIVGLPWGDYLVRTENSLGYTDEWYDDIPYPGNPTGTGATLVEANTSNPSDINFTLMPLRTISGRVTVESGDGLAGVYVSVVQVTGGSAYGSARTVSDGSYTLAGLPPGTYRLNTRNQQGCVDEWYDDVPYPGNPTGTGASLVDVTTGDAGNIDFALSWGRTISGRVSSDEGDPLAGISLSLWNSDGAFLSDWTTGEDGSYSFAGLPPGSYKLRTWASWRGYQDEWYDGIRVLEDWEGNGAHPIDVSVGDAGQIDFTLAPELVLPRLAATPASLDFGEVQAGQLSTVHLNVENRGSTPLVLSSIALDGSPAFTLTAPALPFTLEPGQGVSLTVSFAPPSAGNYSASLLVVTGEPEDQNLAVPLTGLGVTSDPPPLDGDIADLIAFIETSVGNGSLAGSGAGKSAEGRLKAFVGMIDEARALLADGLVAEAVAQLQDALMRTDGLSPPPDFVQGEARAELAARIEALVTSFDHIEA